MPRPRTALLTVAVAALVLAGLAGCTFDAVQYGAPERAPGRHHAGEPVDAAEPVDPSGGTGGTGTVGGAATADEAAQRAALEAYAEAERAAVAGFQATNPGLYSEITVVTVYPGEIRFTYTFAAAQDPVDARREFDDQAMDMKAACEATVFPAMAAAGITGELRVMYSYLNPDGFELWSRPFWTT